MTRRAAERSPSIIIRGIEVGAVHGRGEDFFLFKRGHKLGAFLGCECRAFIRGIGGRSGRLAGLEFGVVCHADSIAPERRARLRLSHSWSFLGQSGPPTPRDLAPAHIRRKKDIVHLPKAQLPERGHYRTGAIDPQWTQASAFLQAKVHHSNLSSRSLSSLVSQSRLSRASSCRLFFCAAMNVANATLP